MLHSRHSLLLSAPRRSTRLLLGLALVAAGTSCVSRQQYDEALVNLRFFQQNYEDAEADLLYLEDQNRELQLQLDAFDGQTQVANLPVDPAIDERIKKLQELADRLGNPGDVTPIPVEGGYGLALKDSVLFNSGSSDVRPEGRDLLVQLARDVATNPFQEIWVRGHTDSDPVSRPSTLQKFPHGNLQLSAVRAVVVARILQGPGGLPGERIAVAGFGPNRPVSDNNSPESKAKNRRVEIFVLEQSPEGDE